jgi:hypothetical protein
LKLDPVRLIDSGPGAETGPGLKKIEKIKTRGDPVTRHDPARPGQKLSCNPLTFVFFLLKQRRFDFLKIPELTWITR